MPKIEFETPLKSMREALCAAASALGNHPGLAESSLRDGFIDDIGELIRDIDRQRPIGPDGKHGDRHTATCGCEDGNPFYHKPMCSSHHFDPCDCGTWSR